jgi:hypothetical protein
LGCDEGGGRAGAEREGRRGKEKEREGEKRSVEGEGYG